MKFSKKIMITLFVCFFISGMVFTIVSSKELKIDIDNAIQTVQNIVLYSGNNEWKLTAEYAKLKVLWDNFVISSENEIISSKDSSILWWSGNIIEWWIGSTILWWKNNNIQSNNSFIGWWNDNIIYSSSTGSVIVGWNNNVVNNQLNKSENSVIIWNSNVVNGSYSAVVWNNNKVSQDVNYSVAMWSGANVIWNNSFLWSDGSEEIELNEDNVFAVMSEFGMVVGQAEVDLMAKLNVWWSFIMSSSDSDNNIQCENGKGKWIMKLVDREDIPDQKCLCNCDGEKWSSMLWNGQCESICNGERSDIFPECPEWKWISKYLSWDVEIFSGECLWWSVIEWSYYMTWDTVYWVCQSKNGNVTTCNYKSECKWEVPWLGVSTKINNNIIPSIQLDELFYSYSKDKNQICSYSCKEWYAYVGWYCIEVCNGSARRCNVWTYKTWSETLENNYVYGCLYEGETFRCEWNCPDNQIWDGNNCISTNELCGTEKYTCLRGGVYDTWMDIRNFTWNCKSDAGSIGTSCVKPKEIVNKVIYYNNNRVDNKQYVYFRLLGSGIDKDIKIKQEYKNQNGITIWSQLFTISAGDMSSNNETFGWDLVLSRPTWWVNNGCEVENGKLYVPIGEKLYILTIQDDVSLCVSNCSTAWKCISTATLVTNSLTSELSLNKAEFTWKCTRWSTTQTCRASCEVDKWQCTSIPENWEACNPSIDPNCNILEWDAIVLDNFYMDVNGYKIVSSKCGDKMHCVKVWWGYIKCADSRETCTQPWFKCKNGYVLDGCICRSADVCDTMQEPWKCKTWFVISYQSASWTSNYSYLCRVETDTTRCNAECSNGKVWNGAWCVMTWQLCETNHYGCKNWASAKSTQYTQSNHKYTRTCRLWDSTTKEDCEECESWYVKSGNVCVPNPIDCAATVKDGYNIHAIINGSWTGVQKYTRSSVCNKSVKCETWELKWISSENCTNVCNTGVYLWTCIEWFEVEAYNGLKAYFWSYGASGYNYRCKTGSYLFTDRCYAKCPNGKYWSGGQCVTFPIPVPLCDTTHFNCKNGWSLVYWSTGSELINHNSYTETKYMWKCSLGDLPVENCVDFVNVANWCNKWTYNGYNIRNNMTHLQEIYVEKTTTDGKKCKATAVCGSGTVTIKNEDCTNACPSGILETPKCNISGVSPSSIQGATWISWYTYKCGNYLCSVSCSNNKIWNGSACVNPEEPCNNSVVKWCNQWNASVVSNGEWWTTWNCKDINGNNLNTLMCYKCNDGYIWSSSENKCKKICGDGASSTPCNEQFLPGSLSWWDGYTLWWNGYICKKWGLTSQCRCSWSMIWNGSRCSDPDDSLCGDSVSSCKTSNSINQKTIEWWSTWTCKNASDEEDCHLCNGDYEWNEQTKSCQLGQKPINWVCAFNGTFCSSGKIQIIQENSLWYVWHCLGENWWTDQYWCSLTWHQDSSYSCERVYESACDNMYTNSQTYNKLQCESAWAIYRTWNTEHGGVWENPATCYIKNSIWENGLIDDLARSSNWTECSLLSRSIVNPFWWYAPYFQCTKWTLKKGQAYCVKNGEQVANYECDAIRDKEPGCGKCWADKYTCAEWTPINKQWDENNWWSWYCKVEWCWNKYCYKIWKYCCHTSYPYANGCNYQKTEIECNAINQGQSYYSCTWSC